MENKSLAKKEWLHWFIVALPFIAIAVFWHSFPEKVAIHWNVSGQPDNTAPKEFGLFFVPVLNFIFYFMFLALPKLDPHRQNYNFFKNSFHILRLVITTFLTFISYIIILNALGYEINVGLITVYLTTFLFLIIGNFMSKFRSNYFIGIKTPWTLNNEEVWNNTHRMAGKLWVWSSLIMIVLCLFIPLKIFISFYIVYILLIALIPIVYSYLNYRKIERSS